MQIDKIKKSVDIKFRERRKYFDEIKKILSILYFPIIISGIISLAFRGIMLFYTKYFDIIPNFIYISALYFSKWISLIVSINIFCILGILFYLSPRPSELYIANYIWSREEFFMFWLIFDIVLIWGLSALFFFFILEFQIFSEFIIIIIYSTLFSPVILLILTYKTNFIFKTDIHYRKY